MSKQLVSFCNNSLKQFHHIINATGKKYIGISVNSGGCNGLKYDISPIEKRYKNDILLQLDGIDISVCPKSMMFIAGTHIRWETDNMSSGFKFDNPNAKGKCGCGTTFNI